MTLMRSLRRFVRHRANLFWVAVLVAIIVSAVLAPLLATAHPDEGHLMDSLQGPSWGHLLGTDSVGRDLLARTLFGGRVALLAAAEVLGIAIVAGVPTGMAIGFVGGWIDRIVMRIIEAIISLPFLVIAIALISVTGPGLVKSMAIVGVIYATWLARLARGQVLAAREELYVDAGRVAGNSGWRLLSRQILPNVAPALIVQGTLMFAMAIVAESTLSFLGLGVQPPTASWGSMLADAQGLARTGLWPAVPPGIAIVLTVLALNQVGDGLRDVLAREAKGGVLGVGSVALLAAGSDPTIDEAAPSEVGARDGEELLLDLRHLRVTFPGDHGVPVEVVTDVSLQLRRGEILGLVGESGSGKSLTAMSILGLVPDPGRVTAASIRLAGHELGGLSFDDLRSVRGRDVGVVFQEPLAYLNPAFTVGNQIVEVLRAHKRMSRSEARARAVQLLADVGIAHPELRVNDYPHQFSGGMAQRVLIAIGIACEPKLLIADEPTTALDVSVQRQILDLLLSLRDRFGLTILLISHDLGVIADVADRVAVMYAGQVVEIADTTDLFGRPMHPYTKALMRAVPRNVVRSGLLPTIPGVVPAPSEFPLHCRFASRCAYADADCRAGAVPMRPSLGRMVRCIHAERLMEHRVVCESTHDLIAAGFEEESQ